MECVGDRETREKRPSLGKVNIYSVGTVGTEKETPNNFNSLHLSDMSICLSVQVGIGRDSRTKKAAFMWPPNQSRARWQETGGRQRARWPPARAVGDTASEAGIAASRGAGASAAQPKGHREAHSSRKTPAPAAFRGRDGHGASAIKDGSARPPIGRTQL
jgi:hypothetical protein